jgi:hypothetical protein
MSVLVRPECKVARVFRGLPDSEARKSVYLRYHEAEPHAINLESASRFVPLGRCSECPPMFIAPLALAENPSAIKGRSRDQRYHSGTRRPLKPKGLPLLGLNDRKVNQPFQTRPARQTTLHGYLSQGSARESRETKSSGSIARSCLSGRRALQRSAADR